MKKILYTSFLNEDIRPGYKLKIHSQSQAFHNIGFETYLLIVNNSGLILYKMTETETEVVKEIKNTNKRLSKRRNPIDEFFLFNLFAKTLVTICKEIKPDFLYVRRILPITPKLLKTLTEIKKDGIKVLYEYPTFPWEKEMLVNKQYIYYAIDKFYYNSLIRTIDKMIVVGSKNSDDTNSKNMIEISNAISAEKLKLRTPQNNNKNAINLLAVAHVSYFHGYDRLIVGMENYYKEYQEGMPKIVLNIVGPVEKKLGLEKMVTDKKLKDHVNFLGYKSGEELNDLFDKADIGIGCLGVHRKNIHFLNSLKNREYAGRGIPFIYSECDYLIEKHHPEFIEKFPENDEPIDINKIIEFYKNQKNTPAEIREFAKMHLSWESQQTLIMEHL